MAVLELEGDIIVDSNDETLEEFCGYNQYYFMDYAQRQGWDVERTSTEDSAARRQRMLEIEARVGGSGKKRPCRKRPH